MIVLGGFARCRLGGAGSHYVSNRRAGVATVKGGVGRWCQGHCCIEAKRVVAMHRSREAGSSRTVENHNKPDIRRSAAWLLDGQVGQVGWVNCLCNCEESGDTY